MILLLGDAFLDRYHIGTIRGMSAEAPIPVVDVQEELWFGGGMANVNQNLLALDVAVEAKFPEQWPGIKTRLMSGNLQLARWDEYDWCYPYPPDLAINTNKYSCIVVCDYAKGSITPEVIDYLISLPLPLYVDTKRDPRPWLGSRDITLFPNKSEYDHYQESYDWFPKVLLKKGAEGLEWLEYGYGTYESPSEVREVVSVNGAGDTVLAAFVAERELPIQDRMGLANCAAAVVVEKPYTATCNHFEMMARWWDIE